MCGNCGNPKASRDQKVCTSCLNQANQIEKFSEQKICFMCNKRPALKEYYGSMCGECTDKEKLKYQCPGCGVKKDETQDNCK